MSTKAICVFCKIPVATNGRGVWWHTKNMKRECSPSYAAPMFVEDES